MVSQRVDREPSSEQLRLFLVFCVQIQSCFMATLRIRPTMSSLLTLRLGLHRSAAFSCGNIHHSRELRRSYSGSPSLRSPNSSSAGESSITAATSLRDALQRSPIGKLGAAYSRLQARRPYATQVCSIVVIWLCGDLGAQLLFPNEGTRDGDKHLPQSEETSVGPFGSQNYDPWRTARHLTVGIMASIPSYEWYVHSVTLLGSRSNNI